MTVTENRLYESTAVAKGDRSTRKIVHTHAHTLIRAHCAFPNGSPLYSLVRKHEQQQLQQEQAVAGQQRASLSHAADSSSRRQPRERRIERENRGGSALHRPFDDGASTSSAGYGLLARAEVKKATDRRNRALRHSVDYRRTSCCGIGFCSVFSPSPLQSECVV